MFPCFSFFSVFYCSLPLVILRLTRKSQTMAGSDIKKIMVVWAIPMVKNQKLQLLFWSSLLKRNSKGFSLRWYLYSRKPNSVCYVFCAMEVILSKEKIQPCSLGNWDLVVNNHIDWKIENFKLIWGNPTYECWICEPRWGWATMKSWEDMLSSAPLYATSTIQFSKCK